jgi:AcrR family transcriptional regulator
MAERKPRTDSLRNRTRLLEEAKTSFSEKGSGASLEEIARAAGVGIGTLYRHFPTRDALIEEVCRQESEQLVEAAAELAKTQDPLAALRAWMLLFIDYLDTKQGMAEALNSIVGGTSELYAASSAHVKEAFEALIARAEKSGDIRLTIDPLDLLRSIGGVANLYAGPNWKQNAKRLVDILLEGVRTRD